MITRVHFETVLKKRQKRKLEKTLSLRNFPLKDPDFLSGMMTWKAPRFCILFWGEDSRIHAFGIVPLTLHPTLERFGNT